MFATGCRAIWRSLGARVGHSGSDFNVTTGRSYLEKLARDPGVESSVNAVSATERGFRAN